MIRVHVQPGVRRRDIPLIVRVIPSTGSLEVFFHGDVVARIAADVLIAVDLFRHFHLKAHIDVMSSVICEKLPDDLVELRPVPIFGPYPTLEGKRPIITVESFTQPDRLPAVMAIEVTVDAHILWIQNIRSPAEKAADFSQVSILEPAVAGMQRE